MGAPGDIDRLQAVLELAGRFGLSLARVRVGDVELRLTPPHPEDPQGERPPTTEELIRREKDDFLATMYAASEGPDLGAFD